MITLGSAAPELRRQLGPTAWVVLEDLVTRAQSTNGHMTVDASTASIVASAGLGRDAVRTALRALVNAGIVVTASSRGERGRFAANVVELHLPANTINAHGDRAVRTAVRRASSTTPSVGSAAAGQPAAGQPGAGEAVLVIDASKCKQPAARTTPTRTRQRDNQLSLLSADPA